MKIYNIKLDYLFSISNPDVKPEFELQDKTKVSYETMKQDIINNGILEPLVILTSQDGIRLESGNHRIYILKDLGISTAPCIIKRGNANLGNGTHIYNKGII